MRKTEEDEEMYGRLKQFDKTCKQTKEDKTQIDNQNRLQHT